MDGLLPANSGGFGPPPLPQAGDLDSVTIVGMGPTSALLNYALMKDEIKHDSRNPIWAVNHAVKAFQYTQAWNMHDLEELEKVSHEQRNQFIPLYASLDKSLVTVRALDSIPLSISYPLKEVVEYWQDDYFFGTIPYAVAFAGMIGVKQINLFGADFEYPDGRTTYEAGRCCLEYWMGRLRENGVLFGFPDVCTLLDSHWKDKGGRIGYGHPYGYFGKNPSILRGDDGKLRVGEPLMEPVG
jgi:hypothetical protein